MTLDQCIDMLCRGETKEEYQKRMKKIRRYSLERDFLQDAIEILQSPEDAERLAKKQKRLIKVERMLKELS